MKSTTTDRPSPPSESIQDAETIRASETVRMPESGCGSDSGSVIGTQAGASGVEIGHQDAAAISRLDAITGKWTLFAPDRTQRPDEYREQDSSPSSSVDCPFCSGNESETPPPVWVGRELDLENLDNDSSDYLLDPDVVNPTTDDWNVRVVPNKYPAVTTQNGSLPADPCDGQERKSGSIGGNNRRSHSDKGLFQSQPSLGGHEVIIESPNHVRSITDLDRSDAALVFVAYRDRIRYWREQPGIKYICVFKNVGPQAGASLSHCHSQLIATSHVPSSVASNAQTMSRHQAKTGCCLQCDLIRAELRAESRVITKTESFIAYCPFASWLPMQVRITTHRHLDCFESMSLPMISELSKLVTRVTGWMEQLLPNASYNYVLRTRPPGVQGNPDSQHWSLDVFPRLTRMAGFEWASQSMINPVLPENAASQYRACAAAEDPRQILS